MVVLGKFLLTKLKGNKMKRYIFLTFITTMLVVKSFAQMPFPALVGYWHNWNYAPAPYISLVDVCKSYNVIVAAFATPQSATNPKMKFVPDGVSQSIFINQIKTLQQQGKKILVSIGGQYDPVSLDKIEQRDTFVSSMCKIIDTYGFDGLDIDIEGAILVKGGTISAPVDSNIINLISAVKQIMINYRLDHHKKLLLTIAPETELLQGGIVAYSGAWGAYLPVVDGLRDSLDLICTQLYNTGSMNGLDGRNYSEGTEDFILAMTEMVIRGFNTAGGYFAGFPANKIAIGLPSCQRAAPSGGFTDTSKVAAAVRYIMGKGPKPGLYTLLQKAGYPTLGGLMTWSINWDASDSCNSSPYEYAGNYERLFKSTPTSIQYSFLSKNEVYPNPTSGLVHTPQGQFAIKDLSGKVVLTSYSNGSIDISNFPSGIYFFQNESGRIKLMKQ